MKRHTPKQAEAFYLRVLRAFISFTLIQDIDSVYEAGRRAGKTVKQIDVDVAEAIKASKSQVAAVTCYQCDESKIDVPSTDGLSIVMEDLEKLGWQWWGRYRHEPTCPNCIERAELAAEDADNLRQEAHDRQLDAADAKQDNYFLILRAASAAEPGKVVAMPNGQLARRVQGGWQI